MGFQHVLFSDRLCRENGGSHCHKAMGRALIGQPWQIGFLYCCLLQAVPPQQPASTSLSLGQQTGSGEFNGMSIKPMEPQYDLHLSVYSDAGFSCTFLAVQHHSGAKMLVTL